MISFIKRLCCKHNFVFCRNIYGDEIIAYGWKRSIWKCSNCGKYGFRNALQQENSAIPASNKEQA